MANAATGLRTGLKQVATAGTRVQLTDNPTVAAVLPFSLVVQALSTNLGTVVVGDANVVAAAGTQETPTRRGIALTAGQSLAMDLDDISTVWLDATSSKDGVSWLILVA